MCCPTPALDGRWSSGEVVVVTEARGMGDSCYHAPDQEGVRSGCPEWVSVVCIPLQWQLSVRVCAPKDDPVACAVVDVGDCSATPVVSNGRVGGLSEARIQLTTCLAK